jgi:hypothetical protein
MYDHIADVPSRPVVDKYKSVFEAENNFINANNQAPQAAYTDAEQEQLCSSLITVGSPMPRRRSRYHADILS